MIPVYQPHFTGLEKQYVNECLDSSWISSKGEFITRFEKAFGNFIGSQNITSVSNGTVAIHLALEAIGIKAGDEVIVPTLTYVASINTILQTGATPVFVDSVEETWQIDSADVQKKITPRTKAIMAVHLYGQACEIDKLVAICKKHNLMLIEDCAEAFGTYYKGKHVGTFGDIATFSFFGNKTITTGEGGMVVAKEQSVIEKAAHLKNQGVSKEKEYWHDCVAYNYRMTNICAAIGLAQLESAKLILEKKRLIASWYADGLSNLPLLLHKEQPGTTHSFWMCSFILDNMQVRSDLRKYLNVNGIETRPLFYPAHTLPHCRSEGDYPVADFLSARGVNLPSYPDLEREQVDKIVSYIKNFFEIR